MIEVRLDIRPGDSSNPFNFSRRGVVPAAILGSESFDMLGIDTNSLEFRPRLAEPLRESTMVGISFDQLRNLNHDGFTDLALHIPV
jgi:hypothetical protein